MNAGFEVVCMEGLGGWHASLATMLAAFVRRAPLSKRKRDILSALFLPLVKYLFKIDKYNYKLESLFNGQMITGIKFLIRKI